MTANKFVLRIVMTFVIVSSRQCYSRCTKRNASISEGKILIDTDAGSDDAIAIIIAAEAEAFDNGKKIIGITCVNGNAEVNTVALNVLKTLKVIDRLDIPVYIGASHSLLSEKKRDYFFGKDAFGDFLYPDPPSTRLIQQKHAVNAMIDLVEAHPGEITLVALGPLTNIALAVRMYPSFLDKLHNLVIMGGSTEGVGNAKPGIEFNFYADPPANYIVFNSSESKLVTLVPWETVLRTPVTMKFRKSLSESNNKKVWLIDSAEGVSLDPKAEFWYCADAVTMAVALTSGSIVTKSGTYHSEPIYEGLKTSGMIIVDYTNIENYTNNTNLVQSIDVNIYKQLLLRSFNS